MSEELLLQQIGVLERPVHPAWPSFVHYARELVSFGVPAQQAWRYWLLGWNACRAVPELCVDGWDPPR